MKAETSTYCVDVHLLFSAYVGDQRHSDIAFNELLRLRSGPRELAILPNAATGFRRLIAEHGPVGPDVTDVHIAAAALSLGAELISFDRGFARFHELKWINPARPT